MTEDLVLIASYRCDFPAREAYGSANDLTVTVSVPEGALPEDALFRMAAVDEQGVRSSIERAMGGTVGQIKAVDMYFVNAETREEIEPLKPVQVRVSVSGMDDAGQLSVVHIRDDGST